MDRHIIYKCTTVIFFLISLLADIAVFGGPVIFTDILGDFGLAYVVPMFIIICLYSELHFYSMYNLKRVNHTIFGVNTELLNAENGKIDRVTLLYLIAGITFTILHYILYIILFMIFLHIYSNSSIQEYYITFIIIGIVSRIFGFVTLVGTMKTVQKQPEQIQVYNTL